MSIFPCISISMGQDNDDKKIMLIYWTNQPKLCYCLSAKTRHLECNKRDGSLIWFFPRGCWFFLCLFTSLTNRIMYHNFHERYKNKNKIYHLTFQKIFFYTSPFFFFFFFKRRIKYAFWQEHYALFPHKSSYCRVGMDGPPTSLILIIA